MIKFLLVPLTVLLLLVAVVFWVIVSENENKVPCWRQEKCDPSFVDPLRCVSWDRGFQDAYYFSLTEGKPHPSFCKQLQQEVATNRNGDTPDGELHWCNNQDTSLFKKTKCSPDLEHYDCYICGFAHSMDERHEVILGFAKSCETGFSITSTGGGFYHRQNTIINLEECSTSQYK